MFDFAAVAVEIWQQILMETIDIPYVLDTLVDRERSHWRTQDFYHDDDVYKSSERQRKLLRLVCRSWRAFVDDHNYRWVTYDPTQAAVRQEWDAMMCSLQYTASSSPANKPRRILFHVRTQEDMHLLCATIEHVSDRVTTLFVESLKDYEDAVFGHLTGQRARLPQLRCLMLKTPNIYAMPLFRLSTAFPPLLALAIKDTNPSDNTMRDFNDRLVLPDLESLDMDLSEYPPATLETWNLMGLVHLSTAISQRHVESAEMAFYPIKYFGSDLLFFNLYRLDIRNLPMRLPKDFWTWCPRLIEMRLFLSAIYFETPVPINHPLKYLVHWPATFLDIQVNTQHSDVPSSPTPVMLHNLQILPQGFEVFIVSVNWTRYLDILSVRYTEAESNSFLLWMGKIAEERSIQVEDHEGVILRDFLARGAQSSN